MFHSVKDAWFSASKHNMADVKELIPEFFYLPEFLTNSNNFDLGNVLIVILLVSVTVLISWLGYIVFVHIKLIVDFD